MVQNMLEHLKCVLVEYKMLIIKMSEDNIVIVQARLNLDFFWDVKTLLTLFYVLPLLEVVNFLIKFAQGRDFFILDLMAIIKICLVDLFMKYINLMNNYHHEHFQVFYDVVENIFATINQDWVIDSYIST